MADNSESPHEQALNTSLTSPQQDEKGGPAGLRQPDAFGPVNIQEDIRPNPPEDSGARPEMAHPGDPLPAAGKTSRGRD